MKKSKIENLTIGEFEKELTQENYDYILKVYKKLWNALETYQEGARLSNEENYLDINKYFNIDRESKENEEEMLRDEFEKLEENSEESSKVYELINNEYEEVDNVKALSFKEAKEYFSERFKGKYTIHCCNENMDVEF